MEKTNLILLFGVSVLSVAIFGLDLKLHELNRKIKSELDAQLQIELDANAPRPGWVMPALKGKTNNGQAEQIYLQGSAPKVTFAPHGSGSLPSLRSQLALLE